MKTLKKFAATSAFTFLVAASQSFAGDGALYQDVADPNAVFVRVIAQGESVAVVESKSFNGLENGVTPYVVTEPGEVNIKAGQNEVTETLSPATYYTYLVASDGTAKMVEDTITNSPAQADVTFYNLSDLPSVDLFVPKANTVAIGDVKANEMGAVALKAPLTLEFDIRNGEEVLASVDAVDLKRRAGVTIILSGQGGSYTATSTDNRYVN